MDTAQPLEAQGAAGTSTDSTEPKTPTSSPSSEETKKKRVPEPKPAQVMARAAQQVASSSSYAKVVWVGALIGMVRGDMTALDDQVQGNTRGSEVHRPATVQTRPVARTYWKLVRAIKGNGEGRALVKRIGGLPVVERARALQELMTPGALEHNQPLLDTMSAALRRYDGQVSRVARLTAEATQQRAALTGACNRLVRSVAALRLATAAAEQLAIRSGEIQPTPRKRQRRQSGPVSPAPDLTVVPAA